MGGPPVASGASADGVHFHQSGFGPNAQGWTTWSDRAETAPRTFVDPVISCGEPGSLGVSGDGNIAACGGWQRTLPGVKVGAWYRFVAHYRAVGLSSENWQVLPRLDWQTADGNHAGHYERVDYAARSVRKGPWTEVSLEIPAPPGATGVVLELFLAHAATIDLNAPHFYSGEFDWKDRHLRESRPEVMRDSLYSGGKAE
jgi:hypothetical protein